MFRYLLLAGLAVSATGCSDAGAHDEPSAAVSELEPLPTTESRFEQEERDNEWARIAESALDEVQDIVDGVRLIRAVCKTSLCLFEYDIRQPNSEKAGRVMTAIHHVIRSLDVFEQEMEAGYLTRGEGSPLFQVFIPRTGSHI